MVNSDVKLKKRFGQKFNLRFGKVRCAILAGMLMSLLSASPVQAHKVDTFEFIGKPTKTILVSLEKSNVDHYKRIITRLYDASMSLTIKGETSGSGNIFSPVDFGNVVRYFSRNENYRIIKS